VSFQPAPSWLQANCRPLQPLCSARYWFRESKGSTSAWWWGSRLRRQSDHVESMNWCLHRGWRTRTCESTRMGMTLAIIFLRGLHTRQSLRQQPGKTHAPEQSARARDVGLEFGGAIVVHRRRNLYVWNRGDSSTLAFSPSLPQLRRIRGGGGLWQVPWHPCVESSIPGNSSRV